MSSSLLRHAFHAKRKQWAAQLFIFLSEENFLIRSYFAVNYVDTQSKFPKGWRLHMSESFCYTYFFKISDCVGL
jgi:hypothetical protein